MLFENLIMDYPDIALVMGARAVSGVMPESIIPGGT